MLILPPLVHSHRLLQHNGRNFRPHLGETTHLLQTSLSPATAGSTPLISNQSSTKHFNMCLIKMREEDDDVVATRVVKTSSPPTALPIIPVVAAPPASVIDIGSVDSFSSEDSRYGGRIRRGNSHYAPSSVVSVHQDALPGQKYAGSTTNQIIRQHQVERETRLYANSARSARSSRHSIVDDRGSAYGGSHYGGEGSAKGGYRYVSPSRVGEMEYSHDKRSGGRIDTKRRRRSISYVNPRESTRSVRSSGGGRERVVVVDRY